MKTAQSYVAALADRFEYNERFARLNFELKEPNRLSFEAGQYVSIKTLSETQPDHKYADYFIFSSTEVDHGFEILLDRQLGGEALGYLDGLVFGQEIELTAPHGSLGTSLKNASEIIMIGTGVGIAPFYSMVQDLLQVKNDQRRITLYWGLDRLNDFFLGDEMNKIVENYSNYNFHPVLGEAPPEWTLCRGGIYDCLSIHEVNADAHFYICADQTLSEKIKNLCLKNGVQPSHIEVANYI